jgi:hypothetical protein
MMTILFRLFILFDHLFAFYMLIAPLIAFKMVEGTDQGDGIGWWVVPNSQRG